MYQTGTHGSVGGRLANQSSASYPIAVTNCPDKKHRFPHLKNEIYAIRHPGKEKSGTKSTPQPLFGTIRSCAYIPPFPRA